MYECSYHHEPIQHTGWKDCPLCKVRDIAEDIGDLVSEIHRQCDDVEQYPAKRIRQVLDVIKERLECLPLI